MDVSLDHFNKFTTPAPLTKSTAKSIDLSGFAWHQCHMTAPVSSMYVYLYLLLRHIYVPRYHRPHTRHAMKRSINLLHISFSCRSSGEQVPEVVVGYWILWRRTMYPQVRPKKHAISHLVLWLLHSMMGNVLGKLT